MIFRNEDLQKDWGTYCEGLIPQVNARLAHMLQLLPPCVLYLLPAHTQCPCRGAPAGRCGSRHSAPQAICFSHYKRKEVRLQGLLVKHESLIGPEILSDSCFCKTDLSCHQASVASGRDKQSSVGWKLGEQMSFLCTSSACGVVFFRLDTVRDHHFSGLASPASQSIPEQCFLSCSASSLGFSVVTVKSHD